MMDRHTQHSPAEPTYGVVWPLGRSTSERVDLSPPISDLSGKTVGEMWDYLFKGDSMFTILREKLRARYPDIKFVDYSEFGNTHGPKEREVVGKLPEALREHGCDIVISGVGA